MNHSSSTHRAPLRRAFSLVEVLVALAVFSLLLIIILVPLRSAFDALSLGRARADVQAAAQTTIARLETDLRRATFVFPNTATEGVTDRTPYPAGGQPYVISTAATDVNSPTTGYCDTTDRRQWNNPTRIDMLMPREANNGSLLVPLQPSYYVVSYYARRMNPQEPFDVEENPLVLYRAQYPYKDNNGAFVDPDSDPTDNTSDIEPVTLPIDNATEFNADVRSNRYSEPCTNIDARNTSLRWLSHNYLGEANLEPLSQDTEDPTVPGAHTLAIPQGISLTLPDSSLDEAGLSLARVVPDDDTSDFKPGALVPTSTFRPEDSNGDGQIDRVTINLSLSNYGASSTQRRNGKPAATTIRLTRTVDVPNAR